MPKNRSLSERDLFIYGRSILEDISFFLMVISDK